jgi:putative YhdH/YhfP family quinone oxidoreductase
VTGKEGKHDFLRNLGAKEILHRGAILAPSNHMLLKGTWAAVVDTVGGKYLDSALRATVYGGVVTTCGMVASPRLDTNVFPFILRGIRLQGIDSAECPMEIRRNIWNWLAETCIPEKLEGLAIECNLQNLDEHIERMLQGGMAGRVVVRMIETK